MKEGIDFKELEFIEAPSVIYDLSQKLKERFLRATKSIKIFSGELHCMLYSHPDILNTLIEKHEQGVQITIITGPVISISKRGNKKFNGVLGLANDGIVKLYRRNQILGCPFMIIDDKKAWVEYSSLLFSLTQRKEKEITDKHGVGRLVKKFSDCKKKADKFSGRRDFLLLTLYQIHLLGERVPNYEKLGIKEIQNQLKIVLNKSKKEIKGGRK